MSIRNVHSSFAVLICTRQRFVSPPSNCKVRAMLEAIISR